MSNSQKLVIIGHQKQWQFLKKSAELGKISHAFLFHGEEKLGKKTLALEFIKLLQCERGISEGPCQKCLSCQQIQKKIHPDLILVEPEKKEIQISQIRDLIWRLSLRAFTAPFKTAIIDKSHSMNQEAQTALLKTLEEPKGEALLILVTEYPEALFPTILSRVQKIKFYPVKKSEIRDYLQKNNIGAREADEIANFSFGKPGEAIDFISAPQRLEFRKKAISDLIKISNSDLVLRFLYAKDLFVGDRNLKEILETWLFYFRDVLISSAVRPLAPDKPMTKYSPGRLRKILWQIQNTISLISTTNVNPRLALEILMLDL